MADESIKALAVQVALDDGSFTQGMKNLKSQMGVINSEFKSSVAGVKDWGSSVDGLKGNASALGDKIAIQKQIVQSYTDQLEKSKTALDQNSQKVIDNKAKVETARVAYEQSSASLGKNAEETKNLKLELNKEEAALKSSENAVLKNNQSVQGSTIQLNNAKGALAGMGSELKQTDVQIKNFDKSTTSAAKAAKTLKEQVGASLASGLRGIVSSVAGIGAILGGAAAGIFKLADTASALSEAQNVVQQTFKESYNAVLKWSDGISESAGIGKTAATSMVGSMGAMLKSSGVTERASGTMSESLVQLSGDLASFYNLDNDTAWEKIRSGISGETEPLKQLGINMSVANLSAYAMSQGMKTSYDKMKQSEQTQLRYNYLLTVTKDAQGDFTRTSGGMANQSRLTKMELDNTVTSLGQMVMPAVNDFLKTFNSQLKKIDLTQVKNSLKWIVDNANNLIAVAVGIGAAMVVWNVASMVNGVVKAVKGYQLATEGATVAQALLNVIMSANPIELVIAAIAGLIAAFLYLWNTSDSFRNFWIGLWNGIKSTALAIGNWFSGPFVSFFSNAWHGITTGATNVKNAVVNTFTQVVNWLKGLPGTMMTIGSNMFTSMKNGVNNTIHTVVDAVKNGIGAAIDWIKKIPLESLQWGKDIILGIVKGIKSAASAVGDAVRGIAQNIRSFLHFSVPDEGPLVDFESWMPDFMGGLAKGIENSKYKVKNAISGLSTDMSVGVLAVASAAMPTKQANATVTNSAGFTLHIEKFVNNSEKDIQQLAYEFEYYRQRVSLAKGGAS